jgi:hypothetical protein
MWRWIGGRSQPDAGNPKRPKRLRDPITFASAIEAPCPGAYLCALIQRRIRNHKGQLSARLTHRGFAISFCFSMNLILLSLILAARNRR